MPEKVKKKLILLKECLQRYFILTEMGEEIPDDVRLPRQKIFSVHHEIRAPSQGLPNGERKPFIFPRIQRISRPLCIFLFKIVDAEIIDAKDLSQNSLGKAILLEEDGERIFPRVMKSEQYCFLFKLLYTRS
ncbi:MAG: hypothetical protein MSA50_11775 [Veillonellaceae bacterium]|nr:hypothetical protein [Veillonellaceae bacterium]